VNWRLTEVQHTDKHKPSITDSDVQLEEKMKLGADRQVDTRPDQILAVPANRLSNLLTRGFQYSGSLKL
jgi:hypothetical protein